jgi:hypothetical protein
VTTAAHTDQDSPKVPEWPVVELDRYPDELPASPPQEHGSLNPASACETETYIPISALLSDEVVEAACDRFEQALKREEFDQFEFPESFMREALQAAIEQVGGGE